MESRCVHHTVLSTINVGLIGTLPSDNVIEGYGMFSRDKLIVMSYTIVVGVACYQVYFFITEMDAYLDFTHCTPLFYVLKIE